MYNNTDMVTALVEEVIKNPIKYFIYIWIIYSIIECLLKLLKKAFSFLPLNQNQKIDKVKWFLTTKIFSILIFLILSSLLLCVNKIIGIKLINPNDPDFDFVNLYGLIVGIFSLYGIYLGFLQFLVGYINKNLYYLGKNILKFYIDRSFWYRFIQTKPFSISMFLIVILPIAMVTKSLGEINEELIYLWQTIVALFLFTYICLIIMSFQIMEVSFQSIEGKDVRLQYRIEESISNKYKILFNKVILFHKRNYFNARNNEKWFEFYDDQMFYFNKQLKKEMESIDENDTGSVSKFLECVFSKINDEIFIIINDISKTKDSNKKYFELDRSYNDFIREKWELLSEHRGKITQETFKKLIDTDDNLFRYLVKKEPKIIEKRKEYYPQVHKKNEDINHFLFDKLIEKANFDEYAIKEISKNLCKSEEDIRIKYSIDINNDKDSDIVKYYTDIEEYKQRVIDEWFSKNIDLK